MLKMGLFGWLRGSSARQTQLFGPTSEGLYGALPKGARWTLGSDPAASPSLFVPEPGELAFDIVECEWDEKIFKAVVVANCGERVVGFALVLPVSDGTITDGVDKISAGFNGQPVLHDRHEWIIPRGHPTRIATFVSLGEPTNNLVRLFEECFGMPATDRPAAPDFMCDMVVLRGLIVPESGRMTARCKVFLRTSDAEDETYAEFFLSINTLEKAIWVSEKAAEYRAPIIGWATSEIQRPQ